MYESYVYENYLNNTKKEPLCLLVINKVIQKTRRVLGLSL